MKRKSVLEKFATWASYKRHYTQQDIAKWVRYGHLFAQWIKEQSPDIRWRDIMTADIIRFCDEIAYWKLEGYNSNDAEISICTIMIYIEEEMERKSARKRS